MAVGKTLIVGASGFIGRALAERLGPERCVATYASKPRAGWHRFDIRTSDVTDLPLAGVTQAVVLFGNTNPDACVRDPDDSRKVNVEGVVRVLDGLGERGIRCLYTSTEAVFDGLAGNYIETDRPDPIMLYGQQKLAVERHLARCWPAAAIVRVAKVYGSRPDDGSLFDGWYREATQADSIRCAADFLSSMIHIDDVVNAVLAMFDMNLSGVYHLGGPEPVSRLDACAALLAALAERGAVRAKAVGCSIDDFPTLEKRPKNISMISDKLTRATGLSFRSMADAAREFAALAP